MLDGTGGSFGSFIEPVGSRSLCACAEAPETVQTMQRYRVLVMALLLPLPGTHCVGTGPSSQLREQIWRTLAEIPNKGEIEPVETISSG